ncbi:hypothetical protein QBC43DRAFT_57990 [Cladorrhinum sp. PSN259]|nr:hypothetical protein QBC43DRAFT_57990 [Cladorrhinum sp. PSN259]
MTCKGSGIYWYLTWLGALVGDCFLFFCCSRFLFSFLMIPNLAQGGRIGRRMNVFRLFMMASKRERSGQPRFRGETVIDASKRG